MDNAHIETEKYAHVTFFFNGGVEKQYEGEERHMIPSPKVCTSFIGYCRAATYSLVPRSLPMTASLK